MRRPLCGVMFWSSTWAIGNYPPYHGLLRQGGIKGLEVDLVYLGLCAYHGDASTTAIEGTLVGFYGNVMSCVKLLHRLQHGCDNKRPSSTSSYSKITVRWTTSDATSRRSSESRYIRQRMKLPSWLLTNVCQPTYGTQPTEKRQLHIPIFFTFSATVS